MFSTKQLIKSSSRCLNAIVVNNNNNKKVSTTKQCFNLFLSKTPQKSFSLNLVNANKTNNNHNSHEMFNTDKGPKAIGPYSQATIFNDNLIFVSGQLGIDPKTNQLVEGLENQTHQSLMNIANILYDANSTLDCVLKTTILLTDMSHFDTVNKIYEQYFNKNKPARATFAVKQLPKSGLIEIEAVAYKKN